MRVLQMPLPCRDILYLQHACRYTWSIVRLAPQILAFEYEKVARGSYLSTLSLVLSCVCFVLDRI